MEGKKTCFFCKIVDALLIIGALNWGLLAAAQVDLVAKLLGGMTVASRVVYGLVGLAGLVKLIGCLCIKECPACKKQQ